MVTLVPLRQKHIFEMCGTTSEYPFVGLAGLDESGAVLGCGGLVFQEGYWIAGLQVVEGGRKPLAMMRAALKVLTSAKAAGIAPIVALCDETNPKAEPFLRRLGFRPSGELIGGEAGWVLEA